MFTEPLDTVGDLIHHLREQWGGHRELLRMGSAHGGQLLSSKELIADTHALALSLERLGARCGDRLAILSDNRPGWLVTDFASHLLGLVTVPIDPRMSAEQIAFILRNSGAGFLVFGGSRQRALLDQIVVGLDPSPILIAMEAEAAFPDGHALTPLVGQGAERLLETSLDSLRGRVGPEDPASLTYTSGATADPKGVLLSHRNLTAGFERLGERLHLPPSGRALSLLPWAHPLERLALYAYLSGGVGVVSPAAGIDPLLALERERPQAFVAPPGLLERAQQEVLEEMERSSFLHRWIFRRSLRRTTPREGEDLRPRALLSRRLLRPIRRSLGGRVQVVVSGFAPLAPSAESFFLAAGLDLCIGYGLVETAGLVTVTRRRHRTLGTVGRPLPDYQVKTDRDGEIRVSGPGVMLGYWQRDDSDAPALDGSGFLRTGDLGRIDRRGLLQVRARRSSQIHLASGEAIAPHPIEQRLQTSAWIDRAVVVGSGRKQLGALIVPSSLTLNSAPEARKERPLEALILTEIQRINQELPREQRVRRFHLLPRPLSIDQEELTRNGQLRRRTIADRWGEEIAALWTDPESADRVETDPPRTESPTKT